MSLWFLSSSPVQIPPHAQPPRLSLPLKVPAEFNCHSMYISCLSTFAPPIPDPFEPSIPQRWNNKAQGTREAKDQANTYYHLQTWLTLGGQTALVTLQPFMMETCTEVIWITWFLNLILNLVWFVTDITGSYVSYMWNYRDCNPISYKNVLIA